ncbi:MAG: DUF1772 domain-containing protein [Propionibacteriaceae bacterium]|nr:DUF1772 domain-containing protein [Propionibacteriaceae bacterium]
MTTLTRPALAPVPRALAFPVAVAAVVFTGAIFGFFYAWVCSTMWGLDAADPRTAIAAMQAMNASVRNPVFGAAFFGTVPVCLLAGALALGAGQRRAGGLLGAAGLLYLVGGVVLTMTYNVQLNEALAAVVVPPDAAAARMVWADYSAGWQIGNIARTVVSGISLVLTALGLASLVGPPRANR